MKNQSKLWKIMKTNLELYRVVTGDYRWLQETPRRKWSFFVTHRQTLHHNIYININIIITIIIIMSKVAWPGWVCEQQHQHQHHQHQHHHHHHHVEGGAAWMNLRTTSQSRIAATSGSHPTSRAFFQGMVTMDTIIIIILTIIIILILIADSCYEQITPNVSGILSR